MKNLSIILACALVALTACTKSKEVHPELGDGNDEIVTVGMKDVHVEYTRTDHAELNRVVFHYCPADANGNAQQFEASEMTKKETFFELTLNDLLSDTLYWYYYELFPNSGDAFATIQKTFHTQAFEQPDPPTPPVAELPTVVTGEVSEITANSAKCGGEVTSDGGAEVTERGICWSINANPTITNSHVSAGIGTGTFSAMMSGLSANTTYHVRAYVTNEAGTAYGSDKEFTTLAGGGGGNGDAPIGAINGLFTINENGDRVYFSQGNLQYQASTNTWRFAENQWDYVGGVELQTNEVFGNVFENGVQCDNAFRSPSYSGWIDLYCWATSGYNHGAICYQPWSTSYQTEDFYAYGDWTKNLYDEDGRADWGYNVIANGGLENAWRTLTAEEWTFIMTQRSTFSGLRFVFAIVNGVKGLIILPDDWDSSNYDFIAYNTAFESNVVTLDDWNSIIQLQGAVFLPNSGSGGYTAYWYGAISDYWSASVTDHPTDAKCLSFSSGQMTPDNSSMSRTNCFAVRLVQDASK